MPFTPLQSAIVPAGSTGPRPDAGWVELGHTRLFAGCRPRQLRRIDRVADTLQVDTGTPIIRAGDRGRELFLVMSGTAVVRSRSEAIHRLEVGDHFGEIAVFDAGARTADVVAATPMTLRVLNQQDLVPLVEDLPTVGRRLLAGMAGLAREAADAIGRP